MLSNKNKILNKKKLTKLFVLHKTIAEKKKERKKMFTATVKTFMTFCFQGNFANAKQQYARILFDAAASSDLASDLNAIHVECDVIFRIVCGNGHLEIAKWLLTVKPGICFTDEILFAFQRACRRGHFHVAKWLWRTNPGNSDIEDAFEYLFPNVCENGHIDIAMWFVSLNPNINISNNSERAFRWACRGGHLHVARWLLTVKPDIDISACGDEAFARACFHQRMDVAKWLFATVPSLSREADYRNALWRAFIIACKYNHFEVAQWISSMSVSGDMPSSILFDGFTAACLADNCHIARFLIEERMSLNFAEYIRHTIRTLFVRVCNHTCLNVASWLFHTNADIIDINGDMDGRSLSVFLKACSKGDLKTAKWLAEIRPNVLFVNINCVFKRTCHNAKLKTAKWLLRENPSIDVSKIFDDLYPWICLQRCLPIAKFMTHTMPFVYSLSLTDEGKFKSLKQRAKENVRWGFRKYPLWLASNHSPNKMCMFYRLPEDVVRCIIGFI